MSTSAPVRPESPLESAPRRWPITVAVVECMLRAGILCEDDPIELIEGELFEMAPTGDWHRGSVNALTRRLAVRLREAATLQVQSSIVLSSSSAPEPDIALLTFRDDDYRSQTPGPGDVLLVVEVSDSTVKFDREVKLPLYARAGIPEVWIVTREPAVIEAYRLPRDGTYTEMRTYLRGDVVSPAALPDVKIPVADVTG